MTQAQGQTAVLTHDCTTLGGNSGSPLIDLKTGEVVGLHFAGEYGRGNSAVGAKTLRDLVDGSRPVAILVAASTEAAAADGFHATDFFAGRAGYDLAFLDRVSAPWPRLSDSAQTDLAKPSDGPADRPTELRYTHFSVQYSETRRQPAITAVNIDGEHSVRIKRDTDKWFHDGRIALDVQLTQKDYEDPEIDRGHMVRREDPNWDPTVTPGSNTPSALAGLANDDTFHYTNAAVQHSGLNRSKSLWQGLENYLLDSARTHGFRACVFTGPIFRDDDPALESGVQTPLEFWKLVAMIDAETRKLHATAYVLSQGHLIRDLVERRSRVEGVEGFAFGAYRTFQIAISDLADGTGYDFSMYVAADPLAKTSGGQEAISTGEPLYVPLETLANIVT